MTRRSLQAVGGRGRRSHNQEMAAGIVLSFLFHGTIIFTALLGAWWSSGEVDEEDEYELVFDDIELLALGEEKDPHALPRLTGDEGAPPDVEEAVDVEPDLEPEPPPEEMEPDPEQIQEEEEEAQREEERRQAEEERRREERQRRAEEERRRRMAEAMGQFDTEGRGDEAPEGSPDGVAGGTVTDADLANMEQTYHARLLRMIERHWEIPTTVSDSELQQLAGRVRVSVTLSAQGHIVDYTFREKSGHEQFDDSIERVLREFQAHEGGRQLPMPDESEIRQQIINRGLTLTNWESLQRR